MLCTISLCWGPIGAGGSSGDTWSRDPCALMVQRERTQCKVCIPLHTSPAPANSRGCGAR